MSINPLTLLTVYGDLCNVESSFVRNLVSCYDAPHALGVIVLRGRLSAELLVLSLCCLAVW